MAWKLKPVSPETQALAGLWAALLDFAVAGLLLIVAVDAWAPPQDLAWKPLKLSDPVGMATSVKFARAAHDPALCRQVLREGGVAFADQPDKLSGDCATVNAVRLTGAALSPAAPVMTCPVALGYAFWTRHVVKPAAEAELGGPVTRIDHYGTFACRNVYGRAEGRRSEHAAANAIDISGFRTSAGQVTVARDFRREDGPGRFLRRVRVGACAWFRATLSPDYNAAHRDHLHLDYGRYRACR